MIEKYNECMWCKKKRTPADTGRIADEKRESDRYWEEIWRDKWYCSEECYNEAVAHCISVAENRGRTRIKYTIVSPDKVPDRCPDPDCGEKIPDLNNGKYVMVSEHTEKDGTATIVCYICPHCRAVLKRQ
jgi:hypothetical protein